MALRSVQLGLLVVVAFLCVASAAGNGENEAGAMVEGIPTRHLLQTVSPCPIDFSTQNYSGVTSVCKASNPVLSVCCNAFVDFACPFAAYIDDPTTNCNVVMFTYLNMAGGYPHSSSSRAKETPRVCPALLRLRHRPILPVPPWTCRGDSRLL